jgi:hypothetical protein
MSETGRHPKERRKARRVPTDLDVQLVGLGTPEIEAQAMNLSGGGFLAVTARYFAPLTKLEMTLVLPPFSLPDEDLMVGPEGTEAPPRGAGVKRGQEAQQITAEGIVVRCEPLAPSSSPERYSLAVAFLHLAPADHRRIEGYVQWRFERSLIESADG